MRNAKRRANVTLLAAGLLNFALLAGCANHALPLQSPRTAVISGKDTAGLKQADAQEQILAKAARVTVDHGFRYFTLVNQPSSGPTATPATPSPGTSITIRLFRDGEIKSIRPGIWDAFRLLSLNKHASG